MKREAEVVPFKTTPTDNPDVCVVHVRCPFLVVRSARSSARACSFSHQEGGAA